MNEFVEDVVLQRRLVALNCCHLHR